MKFAPIVIFAFNRPEAFKKTVESLKQDAMSVYSDLIVYIDGPRESKKEEDKVEEVKSIANSISGFKTIKIVSSPFNQGLGPSLIRGISEVLSNNEEVIVLEDDLQVIPGFLNYMNLSLQRYRDDKKVFSICGYSNKIKLPKDYLATSYFSTRSSSWGWATWRDRWDSVDWVLNPWTEYKKYRTGFNRWGGSDCFGMLQDWHDGRNKSWAIRFCFAQYLQDKVSLFPIKSLIKNDGFDGCGTNCKKWSRFKYELAQPNQEKIVFPDEVCINRKIQKSVLRYSSLLIRAYSKIMYMIYK